MDIGPVISLTDYGLNVGGIPVTSANAENITGSTPATASYDNTSKALTLNGYSKEGSYEGGVINSSINGLNINLIGANTINNTRNNDPGIFSYALTITGNGTLNVRGDKNGINASNGLTISGGTVTATGTNGLASMEVLLIS